MPRRRTSPRIPHVSAALAVETQGQQLPCDVQRVFAAVLAALSTDATVCSPMETLDKHFERIKQEHPAALASLHEWLGRTTTCDRLSKLGLTWTLQPWLTAVDRLRNGATATEAFGTRPGPPRRWTLQRHHALAARILREHRRLSAAYDAQISTAGKSDRASMLKRPYVESVVDAELDKHSVAGIRLDERAVRGCLAQLRKFNPEQDVLDLLCLD